MPHMNTPRTITAGGRSYPVLDMPIPANWQAFPGLKIFSIVARVIDKNHLVLRCVVCGEMMICKVFTPRNGFPVCPTCLDQQRVTLCDRAGVTYLGRDADPKYARIALSCGHETRRQHELLNRVADGAVGIRCGLCLEARLQTEARHRGWQLMDTDPRGKLNYRLFRHDCGHVQRVALANMTTGRFTCGGCSEGWTRDDSHIYLMRFRLQSGRDVVKLGFSRDPHSRLTYQLAMGVDLGGEVLRSVAIPTGQEAIILEKGMHATLEMRHPEAVIPVAEFAGQLRVKSELYDASIMPVIATMLDRLEMRLKARTKRRARVERHAKRRADRHGPDARPPETRSPGQQT